MNGESAPRDVRTQETFENPLLLNVLDVIEKQRNLKPEHLSATNYTDARAESLGADLKRGSSGGAERVVYLDKDFQKVIAIHEREFEYKRHLLGLWDKWELTSVALNAKEERARFIRQFELIKILRILFPDQIPDIHAVFNKKAATVRERVKGRSLRSNGTYTQGLFTRKKLSYACKKLGLRIDAITNNFIQDENDGRVMYIDNVYEFEHPEVIAQRIEEVAEQNPKLSQEDRMEIKRRLERFKKLSLKTEAEVAE